MLFLNNEGTGVQIAAVEYHAYCTAKGKGLGCDVLADRFLQDIRP